MAYFPNGSSSMAFDVTCLECIHEDQEVGCPVWRVQTSFNYDQTDNEKLREALTMLVNEKGKCQMKPYIDKLRIARPVDRISDKQIRFEA